MNIIAKGEVDISEINKAEFELAIGGKYGSITT